MGFGRRVSRRAAGGGGLVARIKMVVSGDLVAGEYDPALAGAYAGRLPTRCAFLFSAPDDSSEVFQLEYVMRMMSDWASPAACDPYIKIHNTGVSVLIQGFFDPPPGAPRAPVSPERCNVVLATTESTGLSLSDVDKLKAAFGVDFKPFQASLSVSCFVRLPRLQLAFRFMGPSDPTRTMRLVDRAGRSLVAAEVAAERRRASVAASLAAESGGLRYRKRRRSSVRGVAGRQRCYSDDSDGGVGDRGEDDRDGADLEKIKGRGDEAASGRRAREKGCAVVPVTSGGNWAARLTARLSAAVEAAGGAQRLTTQLCWTSCVTLAVTLAMWFALWCIKDGPH